MAEPTKAGDYNLRPDRIFAAFVFDPAKPPPGYDTCAEAMRAEVRRSPRRPRLTNEWRAIQFTTGKYHFCYS